MMRKYLAGIGAFAVLVILCVAAQPRPDQPERSAEWLSWSPAQRNVYVYGLITGYRMASLKACNAADELFEVGKPHSLGDEHHPSEMPSARCLTSVAKYSKCKYTGTETDCSAYTNVITEFYTKHPEYQGVPFPYIMDFLSDGKYSTADQLYEVAQKGELHAVR